MRCTECGRVNADGARFCDACGARLEGAPDAAARKTVTIVFTDVAGSTALGESLDPETLRGVMSRYFATAQAAMERHGGTVEKFIGDAVMAVFGVPTLREDDAVRAVRAVVELKDALGPLNAELDVEHGIRIATRTGINTGEVVVGGSGSSTDQRLATGDAVNIAARLEQAAASDEVLIGSGTYDVVCDSVVVEAVDPIEARGKSEPLRAWRLVAVKPDVPAFARPIQTPFVGRQDELDALTEAFEAAVRESACELATIVGSPGIGKSRLVRELTGSLEARARILVGRCIAYGDGISYYPLGEVVREVAGENPEPELRRVLAGVERGETAARLITGAVDRHTAAGSPEETAWAFRRLFEALASARPLVLVVDDIHWAEPTMLDLLEYVVGASSTAPILIVCLARPDLFDTRPSWAAQRQSARLVTLEALDDASAESLVDELLREHELPAELRGRIIASTEGNPLFVEQMLAMLADDPDAAEHAVPATIAALLAARIDRLEAGERDVLQRASVEGRLFHRRSVADMLGSNEASGLAPTLLALARKEFVRADRSLFAGDDGFRFNHVLIRDMAYSSMPKELRADLHARLAARLEERGDELTGGDEIVGYHLEQAYGYRVELGQVDPDAKEQAARGGRLLARAGRKALDRFEAGTAVTLLRRASRLLEVDEAERAALLPDLGRSLRDSGALDEARAVLAEAVADAQRDGDEHTQLQAEIELARVNWMQELASPDVLREVGRRAIAVFEAAGDSVHLADAWQLMGMAELAAQDRGAQLEALLEARRHAIESGDLRRQIEAWNEVGGAMLSGRTPVTEVLAFLDEELAWGRDHGLPAIEADALLGGPYLDSRLGRFDEAQDKLERSKALYRELGITYGLAEAHWAGAEMELLAGDLAAAERELRSAIRMAIEMRASRYEANYRTGLAGVLLDQGRVEESVAELEQAREIGAYGAYAPIWMSNRARALARSGQIDEAVEEARAAADAMAARDNLTARAEILVHLAEVLRASGDPGGASEALALAISLHEEKGSVVNAEQCRRLLANKPATRA
jgi:class 3 adenylate cyclase/tetratricopeptide (TPR) repeat protein